MKAAMQSPLVVIAMLGVLAVVAAVLGLVVARRHRRRKAGLRELAGPDPDAGTTYISPRALELQVRSLEAALAEQDTRLEAVRSEGRRLCEEHLRADRVRMGAVAQALRAAIADQPTAAGIGRLESAIGRIGVEPVFARPRLVFGSGNPAVAFAAPRPADEPARAAEPVPVAGPDEAHADQAPGVETDDTAQPPTPEPVPVRLAASSRVLPVPAPTVTAPPPKTRRRLRRPVAS